MSTIKANDIQNASGGIPTVKGQRLIPTAWVNFNGTSTVAIRDSENVSSITDNGTGDFTIVFTVAMDNADYAIIGTSDAETATQSQVITTASYLTVPTSASVRINVSNQLGNLNDKPYNSLTILGGQA